MPKAHIFGTGQPCQKHVVLAGLPKTDAFGTLVRGLEPASLYEAVDGFLAHTNYLRK